MTESEIMKQIQLAVSKTGHKVFRNNVGMFETIDGRRIRTGLCTGSSDLIGFTSSGRFLAIEVKYGYGKPTEEQTAFIDTVNKSGGVAFIARSVDEALEKLKAAVLSVEFYKY